jgi:hypothetical protein
MLPRLRPGDVIDVITSDYKIFYQILVQEVVDVAEFIKMTARPIFPHDLSLPPVSQTGVRPRYGVVPDRNGGGLYEVRDLQTGMTVRDKLDRFAANDLAQARIEADQAALADGADMPVPELVAAVAAEAAAPAPRARR